MDAIELHLGGLNAAPPPRAPVPAPLVQPELEAPPFEGTLQRDAFIRPQVNPDEALNSFIERARMITKARGDSLKLPPLPTDPQLASPLG